MGTAATPGKSIVINLAMRLEGEIHSSFAVWRASHQNCAELGLSARTDSPGLAACRQAGSIGSKPPKYRDFLNTHLVQCTKAQNPKEEKQLAQRARVLHWHAVTVVSRTAGHATFLLFVFFPWSFAGWNVHETSYFVLRAIDSGAMIHKRHQICEATCMQKWYAFGPRTRNRIYTVALSRSEWRTFSAPFSQARVQLASHPSVLIELVDFGHPMLCPSDLTFNWAAIEASKGACAIKVNTHCKIIRIPERTPVWIRIVKKHTHWVFTSLHSTLFKGMMPQLIWSLVSVQKVQRTNTSRRIKHHQARHVFVNVQRDAAVCLRKTSLRLGGCVIPSSRTMQGPVLPEVYCARTFWASSIFAQSWDQSTQSFLSKHLYAVKRTAPVCILNRTWTKYQRPVNR